MLAAACSLGVEASTFAYWLQDELREDRYNIKRRGELIVEDVLSTWLMFKGNSTCDLYTLVLARQGRYTTLAVDKLQKELL